MPTRYTFTSLPTAVRFSLTAATGEEAEAQAAQLEDGMYDLSSLSKLGVRIEYITFGDHSDTELSDRDKDEDDSADTADVPHRAATVLAAAGLTVLDTDTDTDTGLRVRPAQHTPQHTLVAPVVNGLEELPPPLPHNHHRRATWVRLMQAARNTLTTARWERLWETSTGGEFLPPDESREVGPRRTVHVVPDHP